MKSSPTHVRWSLDGNLLVLSSIFFKNHNGTNMKQLNRNYKVMFYGKIVSRKWFSTTRRTKAWSIVIYNAEYELVGWFNIFDYFLSLIFRSSRQIYARHVSTAVVTRHFAPCSTSLGGSRCPEKKASMHGNFMTRYVSTGGLCRACPACPAWPAIFGARMLSRNTQNVLCAYKELWCNFHIIVHCEAWVPMCYVHTKCYGIISK